VPLGAQNGFVAAFLSEISSKEDMSRWMKHVMLTYRRNKKGGLRAAMRRAKKTYRKKR